MAQGRMQHDRLLLYPEEYYIAVHTDRDSFSTLYPRQRYALSYLQISLRLCSTSANLPRIVLPGGNLHGIL